MTSKVVGDYTFEFNPVDPLNILITGRDSFTGERIIEIRTIKEFQYKEGEPGSVDLEVITDLSEAIETERFWNALGSSKAIMQYLQYCLDTNDTPGELRKDLGIADQSETVK